jgi:hypothetical protein
VSNTVEGEKSTVKKSSELNHWGKGEIKEKVSKGGTQICSEVKIALVWGTKLGNKFFLCGMICGTLGLNSSDTIGPWGSCIRQR